jgi:hypothetical protein
VRVDAPRPPGDIVVQMEQSKGPARPSSRVQIPPEEAIALIIVVLDSALLAWQRKRLAFSTRLFHVRRQLTMGLEHDTPVLGILREIVRRPK